MGRKSQATLAVEAQQRQSEIDTAVKEGIAALLPEVISQVTHQLAGARQEAGTAAAPDDRSWIGELATAIGKVGDPSNKRRILPAAEMQRRNDAKDRMIRLLIDAKANNQMPAYKLRQKVFLREMKIEPQYQDQTTKRMVDQEINWPGIPNEAMVPINDVAKQVHKEFLLSIGSQGDLKAVPSQFVISGKEVLRGRPLEADTLGQSTEGNLDPIRRGGSQTTVSIHGTVAPPAVMGGIN